MLSLESAGRADDLSRQPSGIRRGQEHGDRRDVFRLSQATKRGARNHLLGEIAADDSGGVRPLSLNAARINGVHADLARTQFFRQHAGDRVHGAFRRRVNH